MTDQQYLVYLLITLKFYAFNGLKKNKTFMIERNFISLFFHFFFLQNLNLNLNSKYCVRKDTTDINEKA